MLYGKTIKDEARLLTVIVIHRTCMCTKPEEENSAIQEFECKRLSELQTVLVLTTVSELWFNSLMQHRKSDMWLQTQKNDCLEKNVSKGALVKLELHLSCWIPQLAYESEHAGQDDWRLYPRLTHEYHRNFLLKRVIQKREMDQRAVSYDSFPTPHL